MKHEIHACLFVFGLSGNDNNFYNAWPCSWKGVSLGISDDEDPAEEIQLAVDRIDRIKGSGDLSVNPALKTIK